jgi:hypothetical protein
MFRAMPYNAQRREQAGSSRDGEWVRTIGGCVSGGLLQVFNRCCWAVALLLHVPVANSTHTEGG